MKKFVSNADKDYYITELGTVLCRQGGGIVRDVPPPRVGTIRRSIVVRKQTFYIHRLVCESFVPNPSNLPYVGFKDGNRNNLRASNLIWTKEKQHQ